MGGRPSITLTMALTAEVDVNDARDHMGILSRLLHDLPEAVYAGKEGHF